jgi:hypothetical protein
VLDSVHIGVSSKDVYAMKRENIMPGDTIQLIVPRNVPNSNKHDVTIFVTVYMKGSGPIHDFAYNDLSSNLTNDNYITLDRNKKIRWKTNK